MRWWAYPISYINTLHARQSGPLEQRLQVLRQFVAESAENDELREEQRDLQDLVQD
jgi:hypothetical protein